MKEDISVNSSDVDSLLQVQPVRTTGTVSVCGESIGYTAVAGVLPVDGDRDLASTPIVAMSYTAYFADGTSAADRPLAFIYDGGPGSSTIWMHMGGIGPRRVVTADHTATRPAPYELRNNPYCPLNVMDLVFVDAPGTGFGRLLPTGSDPTARIAARREIAKAVWGIRQDASTFAKFVVQFLSEYGRWNSPKLLFGESYGTMRSAVLANMLQEEAGVSLNGLIMLSQVLSYNDLVDNPSPGNDLAYVLALPSFAAAAWFHHATPVYDGKRLDDIVEDAQQFAKTTYAAALFDGNSIKPSVMRHVASKLHDLTGLKREYLLNARLRVSSQMFTHELLKDRGQIIGRPDARFSSPAVSSTREKSAYDPLVASIAHPCIAAFNEYSRGVLKFGTNMTYRAFIASDVPDFEWNYDIGAPGETAAPGEMEWPHVNVIQHLASAMSYNPSLKVMLNGGYYDLACPFYAATYQLEHLPIVESLRSNVSYSLYASGHTIYINEPSLEALHRNITAFVRRACSEVVAEARTTE
ncbi:MAG TPA: peptidase S10 [Rhodanobacteraceae bacterium]